MSLLPFLCVLAACHSVKDNHNTVNVETNLPSQTERVQMRPMSGAAISSPVVYVYKMKKDYSQQVPVLMDDSRTRIVSYPAPGDVIIGGRLALPTPLDKGYWLDNRGIGPNVAFLTYTYQEYSQLPTAPSMDDLMANIAEKYPLLEIHACGRRADYKDIVSELNEKISKGILRK